MLRSIAGLTLAALLTAGCRAPGPEFEDHPPQEPGRIIKVHLQTAVDDTTDCGIVVVTGGERGADGNTCPGVGKNSVGLVCSKPAIGVETDTIQWVDNSTRVQSFTIEFPAGQDPCVTDPNQPPFACRLREYSALTVLKYDIVYLDDEEPVRCDPYVVIAPR